MDWNSILNLPNVTLAGDRPIPKTQLVSQDGLTKSDEKKLKDMESLTFFASLSKANTYMPSIKDEEHDIEAIIVLRCVLRGMSSPTELGDILHKVFPNPTILLFEAPNENVGISASIKRKSLAEHGAVVVENTQGTGLFDIADERYQPLLSRVSFDSLPQANLLEFMVALANRLMLSKAIPVLRFYPVCKEALTETLIGQVKDLQSLQLEIGRLEELRRGKDIMFAESTKIRMKVNEQKKQRECVVNDIREICNG